MNTTLITVIGGVLTAVLGGGFVKGVLEYLSSRRESNIKYGETVLKGLYEYNTSLQDDLKELREELEKERRKTAELERRVALLERDLELRKE